MREESFSVEVGTNVACHTREKGGNEEEIKGPTQIESRGVRCLDSLTQNASNRIFCWTGPC